MDKNFTSYAEAMAYVNEQIASLGKGRYTSSQEYAELYPIICNLQKSEGIKTSKRRYVKTADRMPWFLNPVFAD